MMVYKKILIMRTFKIAERTGQAEEWTAENEMKINPSKSKAFRFTRSRVKDRLYYTLWDQLNLE